MCNLDNRVIMIDVPSDKILKQKIKLKHYQDIPSKFENGKPMRIYYFKIIN